MPKREPNAVVTHKIQVTPDLVIMRIAPRGWELPDFIPGQYAVLGLTASAPRCFGADVEEGSVAADKNLARAYSIASSSVDKEYLEFYITLVRSGSLTPRLFALTVGDELWLSPKFTGQFTLQELPEDKSLILIGTGTGIAPYMSMLRSLITGDCSQQIAVIHGARHSWDLGYHAELIALERACRRFSYIPVISRPKEEPVPWSGKTGYVQDLWIVNVVGELWDKLITPQNTTVFLCGNPDMIVSMEALLQQAGFEEHTKRKPGSYYVERYW